MVVGDRHSVLNFVPQCFLPIFTLSYIHFFQLIFFSLSFVISGVPVGGYLEKYSCVSSLSLIAMPYETCVFPTMQLRVVYFGACIQYLTFFACSLKIFVVGI